MALSARGSQYSAIQHTGLEVMDDVFGGIFPDQEFQVGVFLHHCGNYFWQKIGSNRRDNADSKFAGNILLLIVDKLPDLLAFLQDQSSLLDDLGAYFGWYNGLLAAVKKLHIQHLFQLLYLHAQCGLGYKKHFFCGAFTKLL